MKTTNMQLKSRPIILAFFSIVQISSCQEAKEKNYKLIVEVEDSGGIPIPNIKAITGKLIPASKGGGILAKSVTVESDGSNDDGKIQLEYRSLPEPEGTLSVFGNGFYSSFYSFMWGSPEGYEGANRSAAVKAVLKPVKNPTQMSARTFGNARIMIPSCGVDYGYDLELSAFVPPHGNGKHSDIIFKVIGTNDGKGKGRIQMTVRGNGEKTGFVEFLTPERERGSIFISDYTTPAEGYTNSLSFNFDSDNMAAAMSQRKDQNYYFRVRCQLNPDGSIKSCHYGKLYGPFTFWNIPIEQGGVASFGLHTSYFNPTPNDRNVEFDTKRNLIPDGNVSRP
jgi:hypothetical protein